jgi:hypothetical protein
VALYLHCVICSRKQANGIVSGAAWGRVELPAGASVEHPSVNGSAARTCPTCMSDYPDWQTRALGSLGLSDGYGSRNPA